MKCYIVHNFNYGTSSRSACYFKFLGAYNYWYPINLQAGFNKVFVQGDYSEGIAVKFHIWLPSALEGLRHVFESTITRLNEFFAVPEKGFCSTYCEGGMPISESYYEK
uniref:Uncharacterized protein n=1 Tax=Glossina brevipalpis TaxID=37001 RepID=A0A1A9WU70_9MUSC